MSFCKLRLCALLIIVFAVPAVGPAGLAEAQSMFDRRSPNQIDQYSGIAARRRGDLLSIVISESTDVENRDENTLDKSGSSNIAGDGTYGFGGQLGATTGTFSLDQSTSSERKSQGNAESRIENQFRDRFSVMVVDVLPNGNMLVSGTRDINVDGNSRTLRLTGVVRALDVLPNNSVPSHLVGSLKIQLQGKGPKQSYTQQGWLGKRINRLWPF